MKKTILIILAVLISIALGAMCFLIDKPDLEKIRKKLSGKVVESKFSYPETYEQSVKEEKEKQLDFLLNEVAYCEVWDNGFPNTKHILDPDRTIRVVKVLNDTSSYAWGEIGTPYYDKTIIYYNKEAEIIGYTEFSLDGEAKSFPYRALMKWGGLKDKAYRDLVILTRTE